MTFKKILYISSLLVFLVLGYLGFQVYQIVFTRNTQFTAAKVAVYVPSGATFEDVQQLVAPHLKDADKFVKLAVRRGYVSDIRAGKFELLQHMTTNEIVSALRRPVPVRVTFNNQERLENFAGRIASQIEADSSSLMNAFKDPKFLQENDVDATTVFTLFLPNTFEFYWNTTATKFRDQVTKEYYRFWTEERKAMAKKLGLSPTQVMILASIVQKETSKVAERPKVAQVYLNRLNIGMPLQADPTVIFANKLVSNDFDQVIKRVYYKHLTIDSPYNTYKYVGLPPGPIFMPDVNAIQAVLEPELHDFLYFCASVVRIGYHEFASTLTQHNQNARKYAAWLNAQQAPEE